MKHIRAVFWLYLFAILAGTSFCTYLGLVGR
jgi:hypothetical protein